MYQCQYIGPFCERKKSDFVVYALFNELSLSKERTQQNRAKREKEERRRMHQKNAEEENEKPTEKKIHDQRKNKVEIVIVKNLYVLLCSARPSDRGNGEKMKAKKRVEKI